MTDLEADVRRRSEDAVLLVQKRTGQAPDYSEGSLASIEAALEEAALSVGDLSEGELRRLIEAFGCYVLEVGRREFGGTYHWYETRSQPVLVVGEPQFHVALATWDKVRGRLNGDPADSVAFLYSGFAQRIRSATPGTRVTYV